MSTIRLAMVSFPFVNKLALAIIHQHVSNCKQVYNNMIRLCGNIAAYRNLSRQQAYRLYVARGNILDSHTPRLFAVFGQRNISVFRLFATPLPGTCQRFDRSQCGLREHVDKLEFVLVIYIARLHCRKSIPHFETIITTSLF